MEISNSLINANKDLQSIKEARTPTDNPGDSSIDSQDNKADTNETTKAETDTTGQSIETELQTSNKGRHSQTTAETRNTSKKSQTKKLSIDSHIIPILPHIIRIHYPKHKKYNIITITIIAIAITINN